MDDLESGARLLGVIERLVDDPDELIRRVEAARRAARAATGGEDPADELALAAHRIVTSYANKTALVGGATAAAGTFPGLGTIVALAGGTLADVVLTLKYEIEMGLCLAHLYGHDIREPGARRLATLLATVGTYEESSGQSADVELARIGQGPFRRRAPRQGSKLLLTAMSRLAVRRGWRGVLRAVPLVGVAFSASANKILTTAVGRRCVDVLSAEDLSLDRHEDHEPVVDARVRE